MRCPGARADGRRHSHGRIACAPPALAVRKRPRVLLVCHKSHLESSTKCDLSHSVTGEHRSLITFARLAAGLHVSLPPLSLEGPMRGRAAFTLIELLVVIAIIAILISLLV